MAFSTPLSERIDLYADGAVIDKMLSQHRERVVKGFTTNPTLMAKAGVKNYETFAKQILATIRDVPISFEVFSDEFDEMEKQANRIASWGENVYVKVPITNTKSASAIPVIRRLLNRNIKVNVTAILTLEQVTELAAALRPADQVIVSIFAGRIADTGVDPVPLMRQSVELVRRLPDAKVLWASPREVLNAYQAADCGCDIITMTDDLLAKLKLQGRSLAEFSLDTVKMFYEDARGAGFKL